MSIIHDALRQWKEQKEHAVIHVPRAQSQVQGAQMLIFFLVIACLSALALNLSIEQRASLQRNAELSSQFAALDKKHEDFLKQIQAGDQYLDTRVQLDIYELKSGLRALSDKVELFNPTAQKSLKDEVTALREELKGEVAIMSKRLHNLERDNSLLSEKIDSIQK